MARIAPTWHLAWTWGCSKGSVLISSFTSLSNLWGKDYCSSLLQIWAPRSEQVRSLSKVTLLGRDKATLCFLIILPYRKQGLETQCTLVPSDSTFTRGFSTISGSRFEPENLFIKKPQVWNSAERKETLIRQKPLGLQIIFSPQIYSPLIWCHLPRSFCSHKALSNITLTEQGMGWNVRVHTSFWASRLWLRPGQGDSLGLGHSI